MSAFLPPARRAVLGSAAVLSLGLSALLGAPALAAETPAPEVTASASSSATPSETPAPTESPTPTTLAGSTTLAWKTRPLQVSDAAGSADFPVDSAEQWTTVRSLAFDETQIPTGWTLTADDAGTIHVTWPAGLTQTPDFSVEFQVVFTDESQTKGSFTISGDLKTSPSEESSASPSASPSTEPTDEATPAESNAPSATASASVAATDAAAAQGQASGNGADAAPAAETTPSGYQNCGEVWDALGRPIQSGEPGFTEGLDADHDRKGCEDAPGYHGNGSAGGYAGGQNGAVDTTGSASEALASTGAQHTGQVVGAGLGAIALGSVALMAARRRRARG